MTFQEFLNYLGQNPSSILMYFSLIPLTAVLAGFLGKGEGHVSPWNLLYSVLIFAVCIPGIFAFSLNVYLFLFERRSIFESDMLSQVLPVFSMIGTLLVISRNVDFAHIPGFGKLSALMLVIGVTFMFMWLLDRTHIYVIAYLPFWQVMALFGVLFLAIRYGMSRFLKRS
jgi:hypothetical protein